MKKISKILENTILFIPITIITSAILIPLSAIYLRHTPTQEEINLFHFLLTYTIPFALFIDMDRFFRETFYTLLYSDSFKEEAFDHCWNHR